MKAYTKKIDQVKNPPKKEEPQPVVRQPLDANAENRIAAMQQNIRNSRVNQ